MVDLLEELESLTVVEHAKSMLIREHSLTEEEALHRMQKAERQLPQEYARDCRGYHPGGERGRVIGQAGGPANKAKPL